MTYQLVIIGGGPAGAAAAVYSARKKIKTLLVTEGWGGQSLVSEEVRNWIGDVSISGSDLAKRMEAHVRAQEGIDIKDGVRAEKIERTGENFTITLSNGEKKETRYLLMASGSHRRKLNVPGDQKFEGRGVMYCATCDAPLFKGKTVGVVGGGNAGLEAVVDLFPYAPKIYLFVRSGELKGDQVTQEKVKNSEKTEILFNSEIQEVLGDEFVRGVKYIDKKTGETKELALEGMFVEIGSLPNSDLVKEFVTINARSEIVVDHKTQKAGEGIWAAGDVSDVLYKQNNVSMGDAIKAVLNIYDTLHERERAKIPVSAESSK